MKKDYEVIVVKYKEPETLVFEDGVKIGRCEVVEQGTFEVNNIFNDRVLARPWIPQAQATWKIYYYK